MRKNVICVMHTRLMASPQFLSHQLDATRISDGKPVFIERVDPTDEDIQILLYFSADERRSDPQNHVIPVLDIFADDEDPTLSFIVFPLLRPACSPNFRYMWDIVDFVDQTLEVSMRLVRSYLVQTFFP